MQRLLHVEPEWFEPGHRWGVGVSGGGDSLALLYLLVKSYGCEPWVAVTVDHGWDVAFSRKSGAKVAHWCRKWGVEWRHLTLSGAGKPKTNPEAAARRARYAAFANLCNELGLAGMVLGHTRSDQVEQFLLRACKGSGLTGLAGIPAENLVNGVRVVRPLLAASRDDLRAHLRRHKVGWVEDPGNAATVRGRIRAKLEDGWLDEAAVAASIAALARADAALEAEVETLLTQVTRTGAGWALERAWLLGLPEELALRLLGRLIKTDDEDFAPRTSKRAALLERIAASPQGAATLGTCKLTWAKGALKGQPLK